MIHDVLGPYAFAQWKVIDGLPGDFWGFEFPKSAVCVLLPKRRLEFSTGRINFNTGRSTIFEETEVLMWKNLQCMWIRDGFCTNKLTCDGSSSGCSTFTDSYRLKTKAFFTASLFVSDLWIWSSTADDHSMETLRGSHLFSLTFILQHL